MQLGKLGRLSVSGIFLLILPLPCSRHVLALIGLSPVKLTNWQTGYCTNIHAGVDLPAILKNFRQHSAEVREILGWDALGVGVWIPQDAAAQLCADKQSSSGFKTNSDCVQFSELFEALGLTPYTINGFPYGNFHQPVVKQKVYLPTWAEDQRRVYTEQLIAILHSLLLEGDVGSISTLPLGWGKQGEAFEAKAAEQLHAISEVLRQLEDQTGRRIVIAIEPEPGCSFDTSVDIVRYFDRYLQSESHRRYLTVCHDICHAAVMNEGQHEVLQRYVDNGLTIGKVQVSSAIEVPWSELDEQAGQAALDQLREFAEDRYLHQTGVVDRDGQFNLHEDLPALLAATARKPTDQIWRIHFHVPIFLEEFGQLRATKQAVVDCLQTLETLPDQRVVKHLEVETYAWSVLPASMRNSQLAQSIASELAWLKQAVG